MWKYHNVGCKVQGSVYVNMTEWKLQRNKQTGSYLEEQRERQEWLVKQFKYPEPRWLQSLTTLLCLQEEPPLHCRGAVTVTVTKSMIYFLSVKYCFMMLLWIFYKPCPESKYLYDNTEMDVNLSICVHIWTKPFDYIWTRDTDALQCLNSIMDFVLWFKFQLMKFFYKHQ